MNPATILVVDDERTIIDVVTQALEDEGYNVLSATSGEEGLDLMQHNEIDVLISDAKMPGMGGNSFLMWSKEMHPETVRIMLTGFYSQKEVTVSAVNMGEVFRLLGKPWKTEDLLEAVEEAAEHKQQMNSAVCTA